jgi:hypothetical protein
MNIYSYEYMYTRLTHMTASERLSRLDLKIHEVGHQKRLTIKKTSSTTKKNN